MALFFICNMYGGQAMNFSKLIQRMWLWVVGFFVGCCQVQGLNPFGVGLLGATAITGSGSSLVYIGILLGMFTKLSYLHVIRYGVIMLIIFLVLNSKGLLEKRTNGMIMSLLVGMLSVIVNLAAYYLVDNYITTYEVFLEGLLVFASTMIFVYGLNAIEKDYVKITVDSQAALGVMAIAAAALYGMPAEIGGVFSLRETFALFSVLYATYRFGLSIGLSWTVIASGIMATTMKESLYLTVWLLITMGAYAILEMLVGGRLLYGLIYTLIYYVAGMFFYDFLLEENSQKAFVSALFLFLFAPARYMLRVDDKVKNGELAENSPEWGRLVIGRINELASAFKRIDYTLYSDAATGIGFNDVGEIIEGFTNQLDKQVPLRKTIEARIIEELALKDIQVKNLILVKNNDDRYEIYLTARVRKGRLVHADIVRQIIQKEMNVKLILKEESRSIVSRNYEMMCFAQKPAFICQTAVRALSRYEGEISGDNFYIGDIRGGQKLIIIADGMGNGAKASRDSNSLIEAMEELLMAGFDKEISIRLVNSYLADKNRGETFTTLDMMLVDLHTGYGKIYKQGAATTYIRRGDWLEMVKSTSLPVGVVEGAVCEKCNKKFYNNDIIVMVSDGILESIIVENKDDYMRELLMNIDMDYPEDIAAEIVSRIRAMSGSRLKDDATIIVCKVVKTL